MIISATIAPVDETKEQSRATETAMTNSRAADEMLLAGGIILTVAVLIWLVMSWRAVNDVIERDQREENE